MSISAKIYLGYRILLLAFSYTINFHSLQHVRCQYFKYWNFLFHPQEADADCGGGLDIDEFSMAMKKTMGSEVDDKELGILFMKVDTNCDGTVDWDEYLSYMLLEYQEKDTMTSLIKEVCTLWYKNVFIDNQQH